MWQLTCSHRHNLQLAGMWQRPAAKLQVMPALDDMRLAQAAAGLYSSRALIKDEPELRNHITCTAPNLVNAEPFLHGSQPMQSSAAGYSCTTEAQATMSDTASHIEGSGCTPRDLQHALSSPCTSMFSIL